MFFLLRMGFWFSLVLLALPLGAASLGGNEQPVGPVDAFLAARDAVSDLSGLCERKPDVCRTGEAAMNTIGVRARESSRIAFELLDTRFGKPSETADTAIVTGSVAAPAERGEAGVALPDVAPVPHAR